MEHHPCFNKEAHEHMGRIHLPVAPRCNIQCAYCERRICANLTMQHPGWSHKLISPEEALELVHASVRSHPMDNKGNSYPFVVGVAGPGDPLENTDTFKTLDLIHRHYPNLTTCISTNGLLLAEKLPQLIDIGVTALTVTVNAWHREVARQIYRWIRYRGITYRDLDAADILISNQMKGIGAVIDAGLSLKVNSVLIPGVNDKHMLPLARQLKDMGVNLMNIVPLIPSGEMKHHEAPDCDELRTIRLACEDILPQFWWCKQCSADIVHFPPGNH